MNKKNRMLASEHPIFTANRVLTYLDFLRKGLCVLNRAGLRAYFERVLASRAVARNPRVNPLVRVPGVIVEAGCLSVFFKKDSLTLVGRVELEIVTENADCVARLDFVLVVPVGIKHIFNARNHLESVAHPLGFRVRED